MTASRRTSAFVTLAELADVLTAALGADYDGVRNGRVRDLPDARTIRWYQTLGIVDRPAALRGRTALYGPRHLLQLAAIKARQRAGQPLADIQRALAGMNDAELAEVAGLDPSAVARLVANASQAPSPATSASRGAIAEPAAAFRRRDTAFWSIRPAEAASPAAASAMAQSTSQPPSGSTLQTITLSGPLALVWQGRPLAPHDLDTLTRLARPVLDFLSSHASGSAAEPAGRASPEPARPDQEPSS